MTLSTMQALATGLPAITTRHSAFSDQIVEGKNGYMVDEGDYKALAQKILFYMNEPEKWGEMGVFGRAHMKKVYNSSALMDRQVMLYKELVIGAR